jgi:hypothetical protein
MCVDPACRSASPRAQEPALHLLGDDPTFLSTRTPPLADARITIDAVEFLNFRGSGLVTRPAFVLHIHRFRSSSPRQQPNRSDCATARNRQPKQIAPKKLLLEFILHGRSQFGLAFSPEGYPSSTSNFNRKRGWQACSARTVKLAYFSLVRPQTGNERWSRLSFLAFAPKTVRIEKAMQ